MLCLAMTKLKRGRPAGSYNKIHPTHIGGKPSRSYTKYHGMLARCSNPNSHIWKYYGGRGITVCDQWLGKNGYNNFVADMGVPLPGYSLDRINNDGNYTPDNCRWATQKEQCANRRPVGPAVNPDSLKQQCIRVGQPYMLVVHRIRRGWDKQAALATPKMNCGRPSVPTAVPVPPV